MWRDARLIAARQAANVVIEVVNRPCGATPGLIARHDLSRTLLAGFLVS